MEKSGTQICSFLGMKNMSHHVQFRPSALGPDLTAWCLVSEARKVNQLAVFNDIAALVALVRSGLRSERKFVETGSVPLAHHIPFFGECWSDVSIEALPFPDVNNGIAGVERFIAMIGATGFRHAQTLFLSVIPKEAGDLLLHVPEAFFTYPQPSLWPVNFTPLISLSLD